MRRLWPSLLLFGACHAPATNAPEAPAPVVAPPPAPIDDDEPDAPPAASTDVPSPEVATPAVGGRSAIAAVSGFEEIRARPTRTSPVIGLFRAGQSIPLRELAPVPPESPCAGGWYAVEPFGYVCRGPKSTLDAADRRVTAAAQLLPDVASALPFRVGTAIGAPRYRRLPTQDEQSDEEPGLARHLTSLPAADGVGAIDPEARGPLLPDAARDALFTGGGRSTHKGIAYPGMRLAWSKELTASGRTWLATPDHALVPKDKVRARRTPSLAGVDLRKQPELALPLAFTMAETPRHTRSEAGMRASPDAKVARQSFLPATGELVTEGRASFLALRDGTFVRRADATLFEARPRPHGVGEGEKWISVSVSRGTLVAYEGDTPVFAFAMSPGAGGASRNTPVTHGTELGRFQVGWKLVSTDMWGEDGGVGWRVREVPWVAYYKDGYAIHGAWWHDDFGRPKSHGCLNLSPADAQRLFAWMDPVLPQGWYAVAAQLPGRKGTIVDVVP